MTVNSSDYGRLFFQAEVFRTGRLGERRARPSLDKPAGAENLGLKEHAAVIG